MKLSSFKDKLVDITVAMGQVVFASAFIDPVVSGVYNWSLILIGITFSVLIWSLGLSLSINKI